MPSIRHRIRGFSLIELMIAVAIIALLSAVAVPVFILYIRRSKTAEATLNIRKLFDSTVAYYESEHTNLGGRILSRQFPDYHDFSPGLGSCCGSPGLRCRPNPLLWQDPTWQAMNFSMDDPHFYSYANLVFGSALPGSTAGDFGLVTAAGDLNCNGVYSYYQRRFFINGDLGISGTSLYVLHDGE